VVAIRPRENPDRRFAPLLTVTSNRLVSGKPPEIMLASPLNEATNPFECMTGGPRRSIPRTWNALIKRLLDVVPGTLLGASVPTIAA
jgi:hypothetical protein